MPQGRHLLVWPVPAIAAWRRIASDSLLALAGVVLLTAAIGALGLYPRHPSIVLTYLLLIIALASTRGGYAALLAALLSSCFFDLFLTPPSDMIDLQDLLAPDPLVFLTTAIILGLLTTGLRRSGEQARRREQHTRRLAQQAQALATLQERQRLARELHDSVSQALYGISLGAHTAREALEGDPGEAIGPLEYVMELTEAGLAEMRALLFELCPESLASEGVIAALTKQVAVLRTRYHLAVDAQLDEEPVLSPEGKEVLYRIAREALHNIVKHASASTVTLQLVRQDGELILEVGDDGKGFDPVGRFPGHLGLLSMQERAAWLGGTCSIESAPAQGTRIRVCIPIPDEPAFAVTEGQGNHGTITTLSLHFTEPPQS